MDFQRSEQWYEMRRGRFTASRASDLLSNGKKKGEFGKKFFELCEEIAFERVFGIDESWDVDSWDMKRGRELEPEAGEVLTQLLARKFLKLEDCFFFPVGDNAGASPDKIVLGKPICAEIKCPRPDKVFRLIRFNNVESIPDEHYKQMQFQMYATKSDKCFYFVYCIFKGSAHYHLMEVSRDEPMIETIKERIRLGEIEVQKHVEAILSNKQF